MNNSPPAKGDLTNGEGGGPAGASFDQRDGKALIEALPLSVRKLGCVGSVELGASGLNVMVGALAQLGAALGACHQLDIASGRNITAPFNVLFAVEDGASPMWLELLGQPWRNAVHQLQNQRNEIGATSCARRYRKLKEQHDHPAMPFRYDYQQEVAARLHSARVLHQPRLLESSVNSREMLRAVGASFDRCVCLCNGGLDPIHQWMSANGAQKAELLHCFKCAWDGHPLPPDGKGAPQQGMVHTIWMARKCLVRKWFRQLCLSHPDDSLPILMIRQHGAQQGQPKDRHPYLEAWHDLIAKAFQARRERREPVTWRIEENDLDALAAYGEEVKANLAQQPEPLQRHLQWLPELCYRVVLLLAAEQWLRSPLASSPVSPSVHTIAPAVISRAVQITRWLSLEHLDSLRWMSGVQPANGNGDDMSPDEPIDTSADTDGTDTLEVEKQICLRLEAKGPLSAREIQRRFHSLSAYERDLALERLCRQGRISPGSNGRFQLQEAHLDGAAIKAASAEE